MTPEVDPNTDPLEWWKCHESNFPRLGNLAKKYLSIQATFACVEVWEHRQKHISEHKQNLAETCFYLVYWFTPSVMMVKEAVL